MSRKARNTLIKLAIVAGLMVYVLQKVQWDDHIVTRRGETETSERVEIVGNWGGETVSVRRSDGLVAEIRTGKQADDSELEVAPGFFTYWRNIDLLLFLLGASCYFATVMIAGARWWWLLRVNGLAVSLAEALRLTWIGMFFNNAMPGSTGGDVVKALYIMKHCPGQRVPALVSVIVDRVLGLASLAVLGAIVVLFAFDRFTELAIAMWGVIAGLGLLAAVAFSRRLRGVVRLKSLLDRLPPKLAERLKLFDQAVYFYRGHKRVIVASVVAGIGNHIVSVFSVVLIGDSLNIGMPWTEYFVLVPVINIVSAVPLMPNGWGIGDFMYQRLFATYGAGYVGGSVGIDAAGRIMGTRAFALSLLYRLHTTVWSLLGGLMILFERDRVTQKDIDEGGSL